MIYNLYIFDKLGRLIHYAEWNRLKQSGISSDEEGKLMFGMLFSIKNFVSKISPYDMKQGFLSYKTNKYALHYLETPTGLKFVINTDVNAVKVRDLLQQIYYNVGPEILEISNRNGNTYSFTMVLNIPEFQNLRHNLEVIYVNYVVRNPVCCLQEPVVSELFKTKLNAFVKQSSLFSSK